MSPTSLRAPALLALTLVYGGQPAKPQPKAGAANGVFTGRSGKPMASTRLILAAVEGDQELSFAKVKLAVNPPTAITDAKGQFQFTGITPGMYCSVTSADQ